MTMMTWAELDARVTLDLQIVCSEAWAESKNADWLAVVERMDRDAEELRLERGRLLGVLERRRG